MVHYTHFWKKYRYNSFVSIYEIGIEVFLKDILESAYFPIEAEIYNLRFILFSSEFWQRH